MAQTHFIKDYKFGHIVIDDKEYTSDVKIFPEQIIESWWRVEGHSLAISDIEDIISNSPDTLIIGTGSAGVMKVPLNTKKFIQDKGIELIIERTGEACKIYNEISKMKNVVAALHLTC